jgi:uncharacterized protein YjbJ (UPF0337 family)
MADAVLQIRQGDAIDEHRTSGRHWSQLTEKTKEKWGLLTDDDLTAASGRREALSGWLQERYGIAREEAEKQLSEFTKATEKIAGL